MAKNTVKLLGEGVQNEDDKAAEAILPGHLVTFDSNGDLVKHATAGGAAANTYAIEREEMGDDIDDEYAIGDAVKVHHFGPGCRIYAPIPSGQNLVKGDFLESAGDGTLRKYASGVRLARSLDTTGAITTLTRVRVEII
jgi:hypothetical protein